MYDPPVPHLMELVPVRQDTGHEGNLRHGPDQGGRCGEITFGRGKEGVLLR